MTRIRSFGFRRLAAVAAMVLGGLGLAVGTAGAAAASPSWPTPTPSPVSTYPTHHGHMPKVTCEFSLLVEHDTVADPKGSDEGDQYGQPQAAPSYDPAGAPSSAPVYGGQPNGGYGDHQPQTDQVEVVQLVEFCVSEGKYGPDQVKAWDVTQPFAWVTEDNGEQSPVHLPGAIRSALAG